MDMDGRSLGTERSSTFQDGTSNSQSGARVSDALAGGRRFAALLANRTEHGAAEEAAEDVAARTREGRTDAAEATYNSRESNGKVWKPRDERIVERRDSSDSWEADEPRSAAEPEAQEVPSHELPGADAPLESDIQEEPTLSTESAPEALVHPELDPNDAQGLSGSNAAALAAADPIGSSVTAGAPEALISASAQPIAGLSPAQALTQASSASSRGESVQPAQAVQRASSASPAKAPSQAAAPRPNVPPEDARALLNEVRMQILDGSREARIQLRPIELGRLDLLIKVDGNQVMAKFAAETKEALSVLEAHAPELRAWLAEDGVESVDLEFSLIEDGDFAHQAGDSDEASFEAAAERRSFADSRRAPRSMAGADDQETSERQPSSTSRAFSSPDGIDFVA
jgi:flagellar hook-length control protein FliK